MSFWQITDYLASLPQSSYLSYGNIQDANPVVRRPLVASPRSTNTKQHFINEWMARNSQTLLDPADRDADDWFELFNPGEFPLDLSGFWSNHELSLPATVTSGVTYRIEYKDDLNSALWQPAFNPIIAESETLSITGLTGPGRQRFFRLIPIDSP